MIGLPSREIIQIVASLDESGLKLIVTQDPQLINEMHRMLADNSYQDYIKISVASCLNAALNHLITLNYDSHTLMVFFHKILLDPTVDMLHKEILDKSLRTLIEKTWENVSISNTSNIRYWTDLIKDSIRKQTRGSGIMVVDVVTQADILQSVYLYFVKEVFSDLVTTSIERFNQLGGRHMRNLGNSLLQIVKRLVRTLKKYDSQVTKQVLFKISCQRLFQLFDKVYRINSATQIVDRSPACQKINLIKQAYSECHYRFLETVGQLEKQYGLATIKKCTAKNLDFFVNSLIRASEPGLIQKHQCEQLMVCTMKIIWCVLPVETFHLESYSYRLIHGVLIPFLSTTKKDLKEMQQDPLTYFEEEEDIYLGQQMDTLKSTSASLLERCIDRTEGAYLHIYQLCEMSILDQGIPKQDALLILSILAYKAQKLSGVLGRMVGMLQNIQTFLNLTALQRSRWFLLVQFLQQHLPTSILQKYLEMASFCSQNHYYNLRCIDFIQNCLASANKNPNEDPLERESFGNNMIQGLLSHIQSNTYNSFWKTLAEVFSSRSCHFTEELGVKTVHLLYARIKQEMEVSNQTQTIFDCLNIVKTICALSQPFLHLQNSISQIFPLLNSSEDINFEEQIIQILNALLVLHKDPRLFLRYLPSLKILLARQGYISQAMFSTLNLFINNYQSPIPDQLVESLYEFCLVGLTPFGNAFEEDVGDALVLLQMWLYRYSSLSKDKTEHLRHLFRQLQDKLTITETKHRLLNAMILMSLHEVHSQRQQHLLGQLQKCYKGFNSYNSQVLMAGLGKLLLSLTANKNLVFELMIRLAHHTFVARVNQSSQEQQRLIKPSSNTQYYSQNVTKVRFFWRNAHPLTLAKGTFEVLQHQEGVLSQLVSNLTYQTHMLIKTFQPLMWCGQSFRTVISVRSPKEMVSPLSLQSISEELHRVQRDQDGALISRKKAKPQ